MTLTFQEAAQILKISPATVRNWLKAGVLKSTQLLHVKETKKNISSGVLNKLQRGANKHQSRKIHVHAELLSNKSNVTALAPLIEKYGKQKRELLLAVYLRQLVATGLVKYKSGKLVIGARLSAELSEWNISHQSPAFMRMYQSIHSLKADFSDNLLSYLHQSVNETAAKQNLGAYYTPASAVKKALKILDRPGRVCDPCCGSGNFLVEAYRQMKLENWPAAELSVFGYDCDPLAVLTARANLTLVSEGRVNVLKAIQQRDFLLNQPVEEFEYIVTNPPWGSYPSVSQTGRLQKQFSLKKTKDSFSFFLLASLQSMKRNAYGNFILPQAFMNVSAHAEIRRYLFSNCTVHSIEILSEKFSGVMTKSILISLQNKRPSTEHEVLIKSDVHCRVMNEEVLISKDCILPLHNDNTSLKVVREIESLSKCTLKGQSSWGLGLVTGNNEKFLFADPAKGRSPVLTGAQVFRFKQPISQLYCHSDISQFQQAAPLEVYRQSKKLIYRFIAKELVFAIDTKGSLTLNSANVLIPQSKKYSCEFICGLFNSKLAQYYFTKKYSSIKVLRSHLETFPLPPYDEELFVQIEKNVLKLRNSFDQQTADRIDSLIVKAYRLSKASEEAILNYEINRAFNP